MGHGKDGLGEELKVVRVYFSKLRLFTNYLRIATTTPSFLLSLRLRLIAYWEKNCGDHVCVGHVRCHGSSRSQGSYICMRFLRCDACGLLLAIAR